MTLLARPLLTNLGGRFYPLGRYEILCYIPGSYQTNDLVTTSQNSKKNSLPDLVVAAGCVLVAFALLYGLNPYALGYGSHLVSVLHFANVLWQGEDWQHCYIVPAAIIGMIWFERKNLPAEPFQRSWTGLAVTGFGLFVYWVGYRADNIFFAYASFQILTGGVILWLMGWTWAKALFIPWAFLIFFYPLTFLDNLVAFPLRMVMSEASVVVLNSLGVGCIKSGTAILSPPDAIAGLRAGARFSVDVADPCSGIRSLFALMMVSALYGYFTQPGMWKKAILFLCSIPLAIAGNLARILMLTIGTIAMGPEIAIGTLEKPTFFHMLAGYLVFAVALVGMLGVGWLLDADLRQVFGRWHPRGPTGGSSAPTRGAPRRHIDEY